MGFITLMPCQRAVAQGEYTGKYLYVGPDTRESGGIDLQLGRAFPKPSIAVAVSRRLHEAYRGQIMDGGGVIRFRHLPTGVYDILLVNDRAFFEGIRLVGRSGSVAAEDDSDAALIRAEVEKIEGFFDHKQVHRIEFSDGKAGVLVQQWRTGETLKQSGEVVSGSVHSVDFMIFEKRLTAWQLTKRRQLYREELRYRESLAHHPTPALGNVRVTGRVKVVGPIRAPNHGRME